MNPDSITAQHCYQYADARASEATTTLTLTVEIIRYLCVRNGPGCIGAPGEIRTPDPLVRRLHRVCAQVIDRTRENRMALSDISQS
jgi:hypothetical protein